MAPSLAEAPKQALKESLFGHFVYLISGRRVFIPEVEQPGYVVPARYLTGISTKPKKLAAVTKDSSSEVSDLSTWTPSEKQLKAGTRTGSGGSSGVQAGFQSGPESPSELQIESEDTTDDVEKGQNGTPHGQTKSDDDEATEYLSKLSPKAQAWCEGKIIVTFDGPDDPERPKNWPFLKKFVAVFIISLCTTSLYMGAAIFTPGEQVMEESLHTSRVKMALGLTLFVWGYGIGGAIFSPMSENPLFGGRNYIYVGAQLIFMILQIPTALAHHISAFAVLRFLAGLFASPPLSTGAASFGDIVGYPKLALLLINYAYFATVAPFLGPLIGAAFVQVVGHWRWVFWFLLILSGGVLALMFFLLPETSEQALLMRRAASLRRATGNNNIVAPGDAKLHTQTTREVLYFVFVRPIEMILREPVLLLMNLHSSLCYSIMYAYFEAFPIAYLQVYGFNLVEMGTAFLALLVGLSVTSVVYLFYLGSMKDQSHRPELVFGRTAIVGAVFMPVGVLIFGWGSIHSVHWILGMIGNAIFSGAVFCISQSYFAFIGFMYPPSVSASAFAGNNLMRSLIGGAFPLFATVMYEHTATRRWPIGWGCTILALVGVLLIPLPVFLLLRGKKLREYANEKYGDKYRS